MGKRQLGRWMLAGVALAVALGVGYMATRGSGPAEAAVRSGGAASAAEAALSFTEREVVRPQMQPMPLSLTFSGALVAPGTATARAKAGGTLVSLAVAEGDRVRAGQSLGRVDLSDLSLRVAERQALLAQAQALLLQSERTHASNVQLAQQNYISDVALQNSKAALDSARAQRDAAQASLQATQVGLRDAQLVAPIDGIVAKRHAVAGERLSADAPVFTIVDLSRLELAGSVPTHDIAKLRTGLAVQVAVEGLDIPVSGVLARIAPAAEAGTRSIGVAVVVGNPDERLRAGQYAVAEVSLDDPKPRLTVPLSAVATLGGQEHVWVIESGALARRAVTTGRRDPAKARVEVLDGLAPGAQVLAARFDNLREGRKAVIVGAGREPAVASAAASSALR